MALSNNLISQFVKVTNDTPTTKSGSSIVYGTLKINDDKKYVMLDGSDILTPVASTTSGNDGDRVLITIKNHTAIVTGNVENPSASGTDLTNVDNALKARILDVEELTADVITTEQLNAAEARIDELEAENVTISGRLVAAEASVTSLDAQNVTITNKLTAFEAAIEDIDVGDLSAIHASINELEADNVTISGNLDAATARIGTLESNSATIAMLQSDYLTANEIESTYITAVQIASEYAKIENLDATYATIDLANIDIADVGTFMANAGLITTATIVDGHITGYLDSVEVNANNITAGTLTVDRLIISGTDKSIIYAINNAGDLTSTETDTINGDVITKRTISADHIIAGTITSNELHSDSVTTDKLAANSVTAGKISVASLESIVAKIGSFAINNALYTNNHSAYNSAVDGVYVGSDYISVGKGGKTWFKNDGSASIGSGAISYNASNNKLNINANSIKIGSKQVVTSVGGRNYARNSKTIRIWYNAYGASQLNSVSIDSETYTVAGQTIVNPYKASFVQGSNGDIRFGYSEDSTDDATGANSIDLSNKTFTMSVWVKSDTAIRLSSYVNRGYQDSDGSQIKHTITANKWTRVTHTRTFSSGTESEPELDSICVRFTTTSTANVLFCLGKIEEGDTATDWSPAPEDIDTNINDAKNSANEALSSIANRDGEIADINSVINMIQDQISAIVKGPDGTSALVQTDNGWTFELIRNALSDSGSNKDAIDTLNDDIAGIPNRVSDVERITSFINAYQNGSGQPVLEFSTGTDDFKLIITNTGIEFKDGDSTPAYINNQMLNIDKAKVDDELMFGNYSLKKRSNGNVGFTWKEGIS